MNCFASHIDSFLNLNNPSSRKPENGIQNPFILPQNPTTIPKLPNLPQKTQNPNPLRLQQQEEQQEAQWCRAGIRFGNRGGKNKHPFGPKRRSYEEEQRIVIHWVLPVPGFGTRWSEEGMEEDRWGWEVGFG